MTIKAVFRVQCDGPCKGWLSLPSHYHMGTDIMSFQIGVDAALEKVMIGATG